MPTLEELQEQLGLTGDPLPLIPGDTEDHFDHETNTIINTPRGASDGLKSVDARYQNGEPSENIIGNTTTPSEDGLFQSFLSAVDRVRKQDKGDPGEFIRGVGAAAVGLAGRTIGSLYIQFADKFEQEQLGFRDVKDFETFKQYFFGDPLITFGSRNPLLPNISNPLRDLLVETGVVEGYRNAGNKLLDLTSEILANSGLGLGEGEEASLAYEFGSGATSLAGALGLGIVFKSPAVAAVAFAQIQQSSVYLEAIEAGKTPQEALRIANAAGVVEGVLEFVGVKQIMKIAGRGTGTNRFIKRAIAGFFTEGTQEGLQFTGHAVIQQITGLDEKEFQDFVDGFVHDFFIGGVLGGGATSTLGVAGDSKTRRQNAMLSESLKKAFIENPNLKDELIQAIASDVNDAIKIDNEVTEDALKDVPVSQVGKDHKENLDTTTKMLETFMRGEDMDNVFMSEDKRRARVHEAMVQVQKSREKVSAKILVKGRRRSLLNERNQLVEELDDLEEHGEEFAREVLGAVPDPKDVDPQAPITSIFFEDITEESMDELFKDKSPQEILESKREFKRIKNRADSIRKRIGEIESDVARADALTPEEAIAEITKGDIVTTVGSITRADKDVLSAFTRGERVGRTTQKELTQQVQKAVNNLINTFDISDTGKKKLKDRLAKVYYTENLEVLRREVKSLIRRAEAAKIRETRKTLRNELKEIIEKKRPPGTKKGGKYSKTEQTVSDMLNLMYDNSKKGSEYEQSKIRIRNKELTDKQTSANNEEESLSETEIMELRYNQIVTQGAKVDVGELAEFVDDLNQMIENAKNFVTAKNAERDAHNKLSIKLMVNTVRSDKRMKEVNQPVQNVKDSLVALVESYNSLIEGLGFSDIPQLNFNQADQNFRSSYASIRDSMHEYVKGVFGYPDLHALSDKSAYKFETEYTLGHDRIVEEIENIGDDVEAATEIAKAYMKAQKYTDDFDEVESVEDVLALVDDMPVAVRRETEYITISLTKAQLIQRVMELKNPEVRKGVMDLSGSMGYTQDLIREMEAAITEREQGLIDFLFAMYEASYHRINEVHKRMYNVSLPKVEFYANISRDVPSTGEDITFLQDVMDRGADSVGGAFLLDRVYNTEKLKDRDVMDVITRYFHDSEYFIAYAEQLRDALAVASDLKGKVKKSIEDQYGKGKRSPHTRLMDHLNLIRKGGSDRSGQSYPAIDYLRKTFMLSSLGLKPQIGAKQLSSMFTFSQDMPPGEFIRGLIAWVANPVKARRIMRDHVAIKYRGQHFDNEFHSLIDRKTLRFFGEKNKWMDFFMLPVKWGDVGAIYMGGYARYNYLTRTGMSHDEALANVVDLAERSQQSTLQSNLSLLQKDKGSIVRLATMFTSSPVAMINMQMQAIAKYRHGIITRSSMMRKVAIQQVVIPAVFAWIASGLRDDDDEIYKAVLMGPYGAMPQVGDGFAFIATVMANAMSDNGDLREFRDSGTVQPISKVIEELTDLAVDIASGDIFELEFLEIMEEVAEGMDFITALPENQIINAFQGLADIFEGDAKKGYWRILGFSESVAEKSSEE